MISISAWIQDFVAHLRLSEDLKWYFDQETVKSKYKGQISLLENKESKDTDKEKKDARALKLRLSLSWSYNPTNLKYLLLRKICMCLTARLATLDFPFNIINQDSLYNTSLSRFCGPKSLATILEALDRRRLFVRRKEPSTNPSLVPGEGN